MTNLQTEMMSDKKVQVRTDEEQEQIDYRFERNARKAGVFYFDFSEQSKTKEIHRQVEENMHNIKAIEVLSEIADEVIFCEHTEERRVGYYFRCRYSDYKKNAIIIFNAKSVEELKERTQDTYAKNVANSITESIFGNY